MQSFEILEMKDIQFISFKHTTSDNKVATLYLNNMNNVKNRFETLHSTNVFDQAEYEGETSTIRKVLMNVKYNKA